MKKNKINRIKTIVAGFVFTSLVLSIIFVIVRVIQAPAVLIEGHNTEKVKGDYLLMLLQCATGLVVLLLPYFLHKSKTIRLPDNFLIMYFVFLYCAIYLGEVRNFYYVVPHWDTILHIFSGAMLGTLGFSVVAMLNDSEKVLIHLDPLFTAIFALCFAVFLGVMWEIYEFAMDGVFSVNMQKFMMEDGTLLVGRTALTDTMKDLIVDMLGASVVAVTGYLTLKKRPDWLRTFDLKIGE